MCPATLDTQTHRSRSRFILSLDTGNEDGLDFPPNRSDSKRENHADDQDEHFLDSSKKVELEEQAVND